MIEIESPALKLVKTDMVDSSDSDAELELALPEANDSSLSTTPPSEQPSPKPNIPMTDEPPTPTHGTISTHPIFKPPPNPLIPQDLSLIMEMVATHQVVGSLPPLNMAVAAKRRLVEQSMRNRKGKTNGETPAPEPPPSASESSSSEESSSKEGGEVEEASQEDSSDETSDSEEDDLKPMTETDHRRLKTELDGLVGTDPPEFEFSSSPLPTPRPPRLTLDMLDEDEEVITGPILSIHEAPLPPVAQPPMLRLPQGEEVSLAGDVVSWMKDRRLAMWLEQEKSKEEGEAEVIQEVEVEVEVEPEEVEKVAEGVSNEAAMTESEATMLQTAVLEDGEIDITEAAEVSDEVFRASPQEAPGIVKPTEAVLTPPSAKRRHPSSPLTQPRFSSAGTVVIRASQSRPGAGDEGWLEEGSVICHADGRVLGTVNLATLFSIRLAKVLPGHGDIRTAHKSLLSDPSSPSSLSIPYP